MERVMLELYTLNADDYSNLEKLMKLCGGSITVEEHPDCKRKWRGLYSIRLSLKLYYNYQKLIK